MTKEKKKSKVKVYVTFALFMVLCYFGGFFGALLFDKVLGVGEAHMDVFEQILQLLIRVAPVVFMLITAVSLLYAFISFFKTKKMADAWDGENEEVIDTIEHRLSYPILVCNILMVCELFFFSVMLEILMFTAYGETHTAMLELLGAIMVFGGFAGIIIINTLVVNLEKKLNPEKRGEVLDFKFSKEWMDSCDEAQKKIIYEAGYKAFNVGSIAGMLMFIIALLAQLFFHTGIWPMVCITVMELTLVLTYSIMCMKLEHKKMK